MLTLDTRAGHAAERLYRAMGWQEGGRIPGYALNADGSPGDTVFFWKTLCPAAELPCVTEPSHTAPRVAP
jgi:hypothetical protein